MKSSLRKFYINTYGCQMNVHESDKIAANLEAAGFQHTKLQSEADVIVFNTCCIRNTAEQKIISHIGDSKKIKQLKPEVVICVVGCLAQRESSAVMLKKKFPHIDIILGTHNINRLTEMVKKYIENKKKLAAEQINNDLKKNGIIEILEKRIDADSAALAKNNEDIAYINITYGCENYCSYCIVPYVRGALISRDIDIIQKEFEAIIKRTNVTQPEKTVGNLIGQNRPKLIYLLGQNVNSYVCPRTGIDFPGLLENLCKEIASSPAASRNDIRINFMSSHPKDFGKRLVEVIAANPKIERNIHLPMQSGCDKILALMNRKYTVAEYIKKVELLRARIPGVHITTDIICGFPGETQEDFEETAKILEKIKFNAAFIFPYSRRSGTVADKMELQIDTATKKRRATQLIEIQRKISKELEENKVLFK